MTVNWLPLAESVASRLCPSAKELFDSSWHPLSYRTRLAYLLLTDRLASQKLPDQSMLVGISGGQGAGKSTLVNFVAQLLSVEYGLRVQSLSLDDFYLSRQRRNALATHVHPLLRTRGVPGTHDIPLLNRVLDQLLVGATLQHPVFDKATDNLLPESEWPTAQEQPDVVLLEGWCVGASSQPDADLEQPINSLEAEQDSHGEWRSEVNRRLATDYKALFARLDQLVYLQVPGLDAVRHWRNQQEQALRRSSDQGAAVLSSQQIEQFVQFFERITRWMQQDLPSRADLVLALAPSHEIEEIRFNAS